MKQNISLSAMVHDSPVILRGKTVNTQAYWAEDSRGRHIYTIAEIDVNEVIKGQAGFGHVQIETRGGTVDNVTETVTHTVSFQPGEDAIIFLKEQPAGKPVHAKDKATVYEGKVYWRNTEYQAQSFVDAAKELAVNPDAAVSLEQTRKLAMASSLTPSITSITPGIGSAGTNTQVTITGASFGSSQGYGKVEFFYSSGYAKVSASILFWSNTRIICTVPETAGSGPVTVTTDYGTSNGYVFKVTFGYSSLKWSGSTASFRVNENTPDCVGEAAAVQAATNTWNTSGSNFRFQYAGSHGNTVASRNGSNEILWGTLDSGTIAETTIWGIGGVISECDIVFNQGNGYNWSTSPAPPSGYVDVQTTALHEFGHWLSLDDLYGDIGDGEYDSAKAMYGYGADGAVKRTLHPDDMAGAVYIYGGTVQNPNGVGKPNILWRNSVTGQDGIWYMEGITHSGGAMLESVDPEWQIVGAADFNGDGKADILWRNSVTGQIGVWYMYGVTHSDGAMLQTVDDFTWQIVGLADFNGDDKIDILWRNNVTGENGVWYMDGVTHTGGAMLETLSDSSWQIVAAADFNGDGKADILWRNNVTGQNGIWYLNGTSYTGAVTENLADLTWKIVGTADFNGDGKPDIIWRNSITGQDGVWYMNGSIHVGGTMFDTIRDQNWQIVGR